MLKSRSKVKRFKQESAHRQTDGHISTHTDAKTYYLPCYAVDNNFRKSRVSDKDVGVSGESESVSASWNAGFNQPRRGVR